MRYAIKLAGIIAVALFVLAGCYLAVDDGVGAVGIELPEPSVTPDVSDYTVARIYVLNGNALVDVDEDAAGNPLYREVDVSEGVTEVSVGPVPSGPDYQVVLAIGDNDAGTGVFVPAQYAVSDSFSVIAGEAVPVDLTLDATAGLFYSVAPVFGKSLVGIEFVNGSFYTATASEAIKLPPAILTATAADEEVALPDGETANSLGIGALVNQATPVVWINTSEGILPWNGDGDLTDTGESDFDSDYPDTSELPPVLDSGGYRLERLDSGGNPTGYYDLYGWFQVDGGLGGLYDEDEALVPAGVAKQWLTDVDLSAFVSGEPVYDLEVDIDLSGEEIQGYFATKLGAFMLPDEVLIDPEINEVEEILDAASFFEVTIDEEETIITQLALLGTDLYIGTSLGVVKIARSVVGDDINVPSGNVVTESIGRSVRDMVIGLNYQAILTDHFIIVSGDAGLTYQVYPIYAGIVTKPTGIFLDDASGIVLIAGETGIAALDIDGP